MSRNKKYLWIENSTRERLARNLAEAVATKLNKAIKSNGRAIIALSGGSTPASMFKVLCKCEVDWTKVVITLVDERCVDDQHILSNARFLKTKLLDRLPQETTFVPIYHSELDGIRDVSYKTITSYCEVTDSEIDNPARFDVVVLGMGEDGHTASFFPDAENIDSMVDPENQEYLLSCESVSTQVMRITWSLRMLLNTDMLALHITGVNKKRVFDEAVKVGDAAELPIRTAIFQDKCRLNVYYAD